MCVRIQCGTTTLTENKDKMADNESEVAQSVAVVVTRRKYGLYCCGLAVSFVLLTVLIIVTVLLLVGSDDATVLLSVLIAVLLLMLAASFGFIEWQRRKAARRREQHAQEWIQRTISQTQIASAPPESTRTSRTSWAFWRKTSSTGSSNTPSALQPSAPTQSALSSFQKTSSEHGPPAYYPVPTRENNQV